MSLAPGVRLGPYEVIAPLGAGGMGEVYRARDTQLKRDVALKVLPAEVSADPERLARFQREAELLAALNHPHIAQIYGMAEAPTPGGAAQAGAARGGTRALVMELVEGPTLAERIARGRVPVPEALAIARQIAEALEYAHERGIIHRDLKPANIKRTTDGAVKVLDFGLAKALDAAPAATSLDNSPTVTSPAVTQAGIILGTAAYMSPEQARGAPADRRADVWAFGVVCFEMLAGRPCFAGESVTDVLAAVVRAEPDWTELPADTPPRVLDLLTRCLTKDRRQRLHDIGDARLEVEAALAAVQAPGAGSDVRPTPSGRTIGVSRRERIAWAVAALGLLLSAAAVIRMARAPAPGSVSATRPIRFTVGVPGEGLLESNNAAIALSPDGSHLAFAAMDRNGSRLYSRALGDLEAHPIPGTEGGTMPFFSPDGAWLGFADYDALTLRRIPLAGGTATTVCFGGELHGASWGADGWIVFTRALHSGLWRVRADGGVPEAITTLDAAGHEKTHRFPHVLPREKGVLFASASGDLSSYDDATLFARQASTGRLTVVVKGGMAPHYVESGHVVFARAGAIFAVPFDIDRLAVTGRAVKVISGVRTVPSGGEAQFSVSPAGTLAYVAGGPVGEDARVVIADRQGRERSLLDAPGPYLNVRLSPDGRSLAVERAKANEEIWVYDLDRGASTRFASGWDNMLPVWSPDGQQIAFACNRFGPDVLFLAPIDGSTPARALTGKDIHHQYPLDISPDGRTLVFQRRPGGSPNPPLAGDTGLDLWRLSLAGDPNPQAVVADPGDQNEARISPDGRWLAYVSNESGRNEVYVRPFPGPGGRQLVSAGGGYWPRWTRGGREVIYSADDYALMSVAITPGTPLRASRPRPLGKTPPRHYVHYDVSADGERFVFILPGPSQEPPREVTVITNWLEDLKRLAPPGR